MRHDKHFAGRLITSDKLSRLTEDVQSSTIEPAGVDPAAPLVSARVLVSLVRLGEAVLIMAVGSLIWSLYVDDATVPFASTYLPLIAATGLAMMIALQVTRVYTIHALLRGLEQATRLFVCWIIVFGLMLAAVYFSKTGLHISRVWLVAFFATGLAALLIYRACVALLVRHWNRNGQINRRVVLVGGGEPAEQLISALRSSPNLDVSVVGIFDDRDDVRSPLDVAGHSKLGNIAELVSYARSHRLDLMILTLPLSAETRLLQLLKKLWVLPVDIRLSAYSQKLRYRPRAYSWVGNVPLLDVFDKPLTDWDPIIKSIEDKVIAGLALVCLSPVMALIALAIKLESRGPVFFKQKRYGFNNELIEVLKFRSMYTEMSDATAAKLVTRNDPRVTRVGRIIRKTSLDELPQFINVLKGELSLVGPRPHATHAKAQDRLYDEVVEGYFARHKVKPGITGWAQINGWRGETDTEDKIQHRVEHDLYYIENWSVFLDLYIIAKTPFCIFNTENAY